jgi:hypothetical protein
MIEDGLLIIEGFVILLLGDELCYADKIYKIFLPLLSRF